MRRGERRGAARPHRGRRHPMVLLLVLGVAGTLVFIQQSVVLPFVPILPPMLGESESAVSWIVTVTLLTGATSTPIIGRLGDMYGKRRMLLVSMGCLVAGSMICALGTSLPILIAGRALQGGALGILPLTLSVVRDELPPERVPMGVAVVNGTTAVGIGAGPLLPGLVGGFQQTFWLLMALGALATVLLLLWVPYSGGGERQELDIMGALLLTVVLVLLLLPLSKGGEWGWATPATLGMWAGCAVLAVVWVRYEWRHRNPFVDLRLNRRRPVLLTQVAGIAAGFAMFGNALVSTTILQMPEETGYGQGLSIFATGLTFIPAAIVMIIGASVAAVFMRRFGAKATLVTGASTVGALYALRLLLHENVTELTVIFSGIYVGVSFCLAALAVLIMQHVDREVTGAALSMQQVARFIGQASSGALYGAVTERMVVQVAGQSFASWSAIVFLSVCTIVAAVIAAGIAMTLGRPGEIKPADRPATRTPEEETSGLTF